MDLNPSKLFPFFDIAAAKQYFVDTFYDKTGYVFGATSGRVSVGVSSWDCLNDAVGFGTQQIFDCCICFLCLSLARARAVKAAALHDPAGLP